MDKLIKKSISILKKEGPKTFVVKVFKYPINRINSLRLNRINKSKKNQKIIIEKLKSFQSQNLEEIFDFVWNFYGGIIRPMQLKEEFIELLKIFQKQKPKYIMEIGTANGGTLFCYLKLAPNNSTIISVDLPEGNFGGGYPEWKKPIYQTFKKENQRLHLLREDSHKQVTLEKVKQILGNNQLDFLFIDGDHSYEGIKRDFEMYSPLVKKGGIIAFHDVAPKGEAEFTGGVKYFWKKIKDNFDSRELIKDLEQTGYGIGVIKV